MLDRKKDLFLNSIQLFSENPIEMKSFARISRDPVFIARKNRENHNTF